MKDIKTHIEVGGAVLTETAIDQLNALQLSNNHIIVEESIMLAKTICFIGRNMSSLSDCEKEEAVKIIEDLSLTEQWINRLKKP